MQAATNTFQCPWDRASIPGPNAGTYSLCEDDCWTVCRYEVVSLLEATQQALEQRAATAALTSHPQPYDVLYNFYCMRSNFKSAAAAQYTLACRLSHPHTHVPQRLHLRATALCEHLCPLLYLVLLMNVAHSVGQGNARSSEILSWLQIESSM